jgi:hypothetical protein
LRAVGRSRTRIALSTRIISLETRDFHACTGPKIVANPPGGLYGIDMSTRGFR